MDVPAPQYKPAFTPTYSKEFIDNSIPIYFRLETYMKVYNEFVMLCFAMTLFSFITGLLAVAPCKYFGMLQWGNTHGKGHTNYDIEGGEVEEVISSKDPRLFEKQDMLDGTEHQGAMLKAQSMHLDEEKNQLEREIEEIENKMKSLVRQMRKK
jgi:hypothetical protein